MGESSADELSIYKVGPCGGSGGSAFDMNLTKNDQNPKLLSITVYSGWTVDGIKVTYQLNGKQFTSQLAGTGGSSVVINFGANEVLVALNGTYGTYLSSTNLFIRSFSFVTNLRTYGPYGQQQGIPFYLPAPKGLGAIVGFHGRGGIYLEAIGIYVQPIDPNRFIKPDDSQPFPTTKNRIFCLDALVSSLAPKDGVVTMVAEDSYDENQEWIKDTRYSAYKDKDGQPAFTLFHSSSGKYLISQGNSLVLVSVDIKELEKTALWTEGPDDLSSGFHTIRTFNDTDIVFNYERGTSPSVKLSQVKYDGDDMAVTKGISWKIVTLSCK